MRSPDDNPLSNYAIQCLFHDAQFSKSNHPSLKKNLTSILRKSKIEDFLSDFIKAIKICLIHDEKSCNVERTLDFAADFAVSFSSDLKEDETCPLLEGVFKFIFENHDCHTQLVRLRICQLMNRLLDNMGQDATVLEETYNKIAESMLVRLRDSMTSVRTQAVYALHRLQSPNDPNCEIMKAFVFHMTHDPCFDVRRAVMQKIAVNKMTLASILTRMNDVKDTVRKEAYIIINRFLIRQFTIKQRQLILESGLEDRSEMTRDYAINVLVPNWLKYFDYNYYKFLECIHVEKIPDTAIKLLKILFEKQQDSILESRLKNMWIINSRIPYHKLNIVSVVYWRALAEYLKPTDNDDKHEHIFQQVVPDLTPFCLYIRGYFFPTEECDMELPPANESPGTSQERNTSLIQMEAVNVSSEQNQIENPPSASSASPEASIEEVKTSPEVNEKIEQVNAPHVPDEDVLVHLLQMCKVFDLSDEKGRTSLQELCVDFLQSSLVSLQTVPVLGSLLNHVVPNTADKLNIMTEVITELREPLQANENSVYVPDILLIEAEEKKVELGIKIADLEAELEISRELEDGARMQEIQFAIASVKDELRIMNTVTPNEPGRNLNNDPTILKKCLTLVVEIMKRGKISKMNPTLYSLMQNFIIPTLNLKIEKEGASLVKNLALQALGIFCVLDSELAKEQFMMFCFNIANETMSVTSLKCVFDLLHIYGLAHFNIEDPDEVSIRETSLEEGQQHRPNLVVLLISLLSSESLDMKKTAVIGLCKLLFAGRIKSHSLISKLILLWYNPTIECEPHIRQPLGVFFRMFAESCPHAPPLLIKAFIPTMKEFFKLEVTDPMMEVDVESVANLMVELSRPGLNLHTSKDLSIHNQIAIQICEELLSEELEPPCCLVLIKVLNQLELNLDFTTDINILSALISRVIKSLIKEEKNAHRLAVKFERMLVQPRLENSTVASTVDNTLPPETSLRSNITSNKSLLLLSTEDDTQSESESEEEPEEEDLSQIESISRITIGSEDVVIPGTPETSDSEQEDNSLSELGPPLIKCLKISPGSSFKQPGAPTTKTPFKVPAKTPRKAAKTPAKSDIPPSPKQTRSSAKTPGNAPSTSKDKTQSTSKEKTPAKSTRSTRTPARTRLALSPERRENAVTSEGRVTRSAKKRKS